MGKASISSFLIVLLNVAWYIVALAMVLTIVPCRSLRFHDIGIGDLAAAVRIDIPVSFNVDARALPVSAPSLGIEGRRNSSMSADRMKFSPPAGPLVAPALLGLVAVMLALVLLVLGQLVRFFARCAMAGRSCPANATRIR